MRILVSLFILCFMRLGLYGQNRIEVCTGKASHIVCPEKVTYLLSGDPASVICEIVPEHLNLVRVKAAGNFEGESSLTLVSGGKVYSLFVSCGSPSEIIYHLGTFSGERTGTGGGGPLPEYALAELSRKILFKKGKHKSRRIKKEGIVLRVENIWQNNDLLFFELSVTNKTNITYDVEDFHWWITDRKQVKATNVQEFAVYPSYQYYGLKSIPGNTTLKEVFVVSKLTIPGKRVLKIEMLETALGNTGRQLCLKIKNRDILHARTLK
ncbi:DUF4138 domain-containing protein [Maribellus maritimus]|uniref:DUF4138 domain-containing protein n=1 Tax=Maribellus maritimus TaxID=2870838 RepID=UPI001EEBD544|nr:DUF4138 domain-containing protein [Maribellus maritimus]MCG6190856.1 conjugative transposon protein TraN [Maribellus maritimus]